MQPCLLLIELLLELALVVGRLGVEDGRRRGRVDPRRAVRKTPQNFRELKGDKIDCCCEALVQGCTKRLFPGCADME